MIIKQTDKILLICLNPDDAAIACGGLICKCKNQVDILCANLGGIQYEAETLPEQTSNEIFYKNFDLISKKININRYYIQKITESFGTIDLCIKDCLSNINTKEYDVILAPQQNESHSDYKFLGSVFLKTLLSRGGYKETLKIMRYELWTPIKDANYYEDITSVIENKRELIECYKVSSNGMLIDNILNMNKFRTFTSYLAGKAQYVEAYLADDLYAFMQVPDIINEETEKDYQNEELALFFKDKKVQEKIYNLSLRYRGERVVLYGAGEYSRFLFKNYNLSKLNIRAIADERFAQPRKHEFYGLDCIIPENLKNIDCDVIIISEQDFVKSYNTLAKILKETKNQSIEIIPIIKSELKGTENMVCARPFHTLSIMLGGYCITCCPAYINNYAIGNLSEQNLKNIWNNTNANNLRQLLLNEDYSFCDLNTCIQTELIDKDEILKYYDETGAVKMPDTIFMGWDNDCNVACITCRNNIIKNSERDIENLQAIEADVLEACKTAKVFYTSGNGDPFGSSYARNLIKKVAETNPDIKFFIHTNGILCTEKICEELSIKDRILNVIFSIHAAHKETYDKIVRYGNFDKVMQNLEWISELKRKGQIQKVILAFVVHKLNYKDMPDFVRIAEKFDAQASFRYYRQWANNTEYKYDDMAVFQKQHEEYPQFVSVLQDEIFDSPHCNLDPSIRAIRGK